MKKIVFAFAVLLLAAPTWALDVWCTNDVNLCTVSYDASLDDPNIRAMALDIQLDGDGTISDVQCLSASYGYQIYPGSISIDGSGNVDDWGTCKASGSYAGTLDDVNAMTIEMGSLYEEGVDPEPNDLGDLVSFIVDGTGTVNVSISVNTIRGGCVDEDAGVVTPSITGCSFEFAGTTCWDLDQCAGQPSGDGTCDGTINFSDLIQLKQAFGTSKGAGNYNCCADYDQNETINFGDLIILKQGFGSSGYAPSTLNQDCPP
jgi:hypothetical protein